MFINISANRGAIVVVSAPRIFRIRQRGTSVDARNATGLFEGRSNVSNGGLKRRWAFRWSSALSVASKWSSALRVSMVRPLRRTASAFLLSEVAVLLGGVPLYRLLCATAHRLLRLLIIRGIIDKLHWWRFLRVWNTSGRVVKKSPQSAFFGHSGAMCHFSFLDLLRKRSVGHLRSLSVVKAFQLLRSWIGMVSARWR